MTAPNVLPRALLAAIGVGFLLGYALPLLVAPLGWARRLGWKVPAEKPLTVYFGRCVGGLALVVTALSLRAATAPRAHLETVDLLIGVGTVMTGVHVWGAVEREQPPAETLEIALYLVLTVLLYVARSALR